MMKKLYFVRTNGYDMLVSYDTDKCVRYLTEIEDFPKDDKEIDKFLESIEDDSSWECDGYVDDLEGWLNLDGHLGDVSEILFEIEKEI